MATPLTATHTNNAYLTSQVMRATAASLALASSVLNFDIMELWYVSNNKLRCEYVHVCEDLLSKYTRPVNSSHPSVEGSGSSDAEAHSPQMQMECSLISGHYPNHKKKHARSPQLCEWATQNKDRYVWNHVGVDNFSSVSSVSAPATDVATTSVPFSTSVPSRSPRQQSGPVFRTEMAYLLELSETNGVHIFIVGFATEQIAYTPSKLKFLSGLGYAIYIAAFDSNCFENSSVSDGSGSTSAEGGSDTQAQRAKALDSKLFVPRHELQQIRWTDPNENSVLETTSSDIVFNASSEDNASSGGGATTVLSSSLPPLFIDMDSADGTSVASSPFEIGSLDSWDFGGHSQGLSVLTRQSRAQSLASMDGMSYSSNNNTPTKADILGGSQSNVYVVPMDNHMLHVRRSGSITSICSSVSTGGSDLDYSVDGSAVLAAAVAGIAGSDNASERTLHGSSHNSSNNSSNNSLMSAVYNKSLSRTGSAISDMGGGGVSPTFSNTHSHTFNECDSDDADEFDFYLLDDSSCGTVSRQPSPGNPHPSATSVSPGLIEQMLTQSEHSSSHGRRRHRTVSGDSSSKVADIPEVVVVATNEMAADIPAEDAPQLHSPLPSKPSSLMLFDTSDVVGIALSPKRRSEHAQVLTFDDAILANQQQVQTQTKSRTPPPASPPSSIAATGFQAAATVSTTTPTVDISPTSVVGASRGSFSQQPAMQAQPHAEQNVSVVQHTAPPPTSLPQRHGVQFHRAQMREQHQAQQRINKQPLTVEAPTESYDLESEDDHQNQPACAQHPVPHVQHMHHPQIPLPPTWAPQDSFGFPVGQLAVRHIIRDNLELKDFSNIRYIADGSNSNVYLGEMIVSMPSRPLHPHTQPQQAVRQTVIIKMMSEDAEQRAVCVHEFNVEHGMLARMDHVNIIKILGAGRLPRRFVVLEYLGGGSLHDLLNKNKHTSQQHKLSSLTHTITSQLFRRPTFTYLQLLTHTRQLATACWYLHSHIHPQALIIHRDIKPDNIGFTADGTLKLFDFGLCTCVRKREFADEKYEMTGHTGSLRYMAPEVASDQPYTEKADVYSFAITVWQMAKDKVPFDGLTREEFYDQVVTNAMRPKLDKSWPSRFKDLLCCCWAHNQEDRPSFTEILSVLNELISDTHGGGGGNSHKK